MLPKQITLLFVLLMTAAFVRSQNSGILKAKAEAYGKELSALSAGHGGTKKRGLGNALLSFYQKRISSLISADCVYELSCSRFSREAVNKKGLFLGVLLSADRLSRCSYPCTKEIPAYKFNKDGLAKDTP